MLMFTTFALNIKEALFWPNFFSQGHLGKRNCVKQNFIKPYYKETILSKKRNLFEK